MTNDTDPPFDVTRDPVAGTESVTTPATVRSAKKAPSAGALAVKAVTGVVAEFDKVEAGLQALEKKYAGKVYDVTTTAGMAEAKIARADIRQVRYAVQNREREAKRPLNELKAAISAQAGTIIERLLAIEDPIDAPITAEEERRAAEKAAREREAQERAARIADMILRIVNAPVAVVNAGVDAIDRQIDYVTEAFVTDIETFDDRAGEAEQAKASTLATLQAMREQRVVYEAAQAQLAQEREAQRLRDEEARREREEAARVERERVAAQAAENARAAAALKAERDAFEAEKRAEQARKDAIAAKEAADLAAANARAEQIAQEKRDRLNYDLQAIVDLGGADTLETIEMALETLKGVDMSEGHWGGQMRAAQAAHEATYKALIERRATLGDMSENLVSPQTFQQAATSEVIDAAEDDADTELLVAAESVVEEFATLLPPALAMLPNALGGAVARLRRATRAVRNLE